MKFEITDEIPARGPGSSLMRGAVIGVPQGNSFQIAEASVTTPGSRALGTAIRSSSATRP